VVSFSFAYHLVSCFVRKSAFLSTHLRTFVLILVPFSYTSVNVKVGRTFWFHLFFNDSATTEIYTLSLHDALPIWRSRRGDSEGVGS